MQRRLSLEEIKEVEIGILDYVVMFCQKHNLNYSLSYGTLLGAIRHKGFIPWDDDIDICMPREDYMQLLALMEIEKSKDFKLLKPNEDNYYYEFAKVVDTRTIAIENKVKQDYKLGVWIDIFPLDGIPPCYHLNRLIINALVYGRVASIYAVVPPIQMKLLYPFVYLFWVFTKLIGPSFFLRKISKKVQQYSYKDAQYVTCLLDPDSNKHYFKKEMFDDLIEVEFEHKYYLAPRNYDLYLRGLYGDYMKLPPEGQREVHDFEVYWK